LALESFTKYLRYERHYSEHTITSYTRDLEQYSLYLVSHLDLTDPAKALHVHVRSWIVHLMQSDYTAQSVNRKLSTLKSYYKYLKKMELIKVNPSSKISGPKLPKRLPTVIRETDLEIGLKELSAEKGEEKDFPTYRDELMIQLLYQTGMRRSELINLKDSDINTKRLEIKVLGKGNKERLIPITHGLVDCITSYQNIRDELYEKKEGYLLLTDRGRSLYPKYVYNKVSAWISKYSTSMKQSPHVLRHSFATHLANNGAELNAIKELLGHASLAATEVYMHNSVERLKEVYSKAHPRTRKKR